VYISSKATKKNRYYFGLIAEYIACLWYLLKFYRPLCHRFKTCVGEIDLVLVRFDTLVFVEVKARTGRVTECIDDRGIKRISGAANLFLSKNPKFNNYRIRFDLVLITPYSLPKVIENAWSCGSIIY
jgi:putative endonuclease